MNAYLPRSAETLPLAAALLAAIFIAGLLLNRHRSGLASWALVIISFAAAERICAREPAGLRMLVLCGAGLFAMKAVVAVGDETRLSPLRWLAWAAGWPGMRPALFATAGTSRVEGAGALAVRGLTWLALGASLIALAWMARGTRLLATVLVLPGLSLVLHFGVFNLVAGGWRLLGVEADRLFRAPLESRTLAEFWGRRWNIAFTEMTQIAIYRPLSKRWGRGAGVAAAFLFSGLLHELAISVPARGGYGLPLLYFLIHGGLMLVERKIPFGRWGRVWTIFWLAAPIPILFHPPFLRGVVWPLIGAR